MGSPIQHSYSGAWIGRGSVLFTRSLGTSNVAQSHHHCSRPGEQGGTRGRLTRPRLEEAQDVKDMDLVNVSEPQLLRL